MTDFERGLLTAAAQAYRLAEAERVVANRLPFHKEAQQKKHELRAELHENFAKWCEREAGTYIGASRVLIGL